MMCPATNLRRSCPTRCAAGCRSIIPARSTSMGGRDDLQKLSSALFWREPLLARVESWHRGQSFGDSKGIKICRRKRIRTRSHSAVSAANRKVTAKRKRRERTPSWAAGPRGGPASRSRPQRERRNTMPCEEMPEHMRMWLFERNRRDCLRELPTVELADWCVALAVECSRRGVHVVDVMGTLQKRLEYLTEVQCS